MTDRMTAAEANKAIAASKGATKGRVRGTQRVTVQGIKFDSKREANQYLLLRDQEKRGEIRGLRLQVPFMLLGKYGPILTPTGRTMTYRADFVFWDVLQARERVLDAKGHQTDVSVMKLAIMAAQGVQVECV
jgi:hypothetical protein